eukprot:CAMPEP_0114423204 /NCGR_PEP_ID=MMETSP0103-20121206/6025_1 /TAXON_ID=37642 ORGANISM="Paraphysomonas imperforata, Strain PA2" /NCGR_SAMPLE_ID=MMETSP0103 /ASSEMBLY_ACC=CAM_ASM_000201 /LENGTH=1099 /DNA_ID=CAMNT_0001591853 /DNA_START=45 /DNA_END=3341 /DNA_ORIENTATION=-
MSDTEIQNEELNVLYHAAKLGRTDIVQHAVSTLREKGALSQDELVDAISTPNDNGASALHIAAFNGHADVVRALLNMGARPTMSFDYGEFSYKSAYEVANHAAIQAFHVYLFEQIAMGHSSVIEDLVSGGIPADLADDSDTADTTLHWAISFSNINAAQLLLNLGVPVDIVNNQGKSCLHLACQGANKLFIELLLNWGADVGLMDETGKVPSDYLKKDKADLFELLESPVDEILTSPVKLKKSSCEGDHDGSGDEGKDSVSDEDCENEDDTSIRNDDPCGGEDVTNNNNLDSTGSYVMLDNSIQSPESSSRTSRDVNDRDKRDIEHDFKDGVASSGSSGPLPYSSSSSTSSTYSVSSSTDELSPQLILWPPAQRQYQNSIEDPHIVSLDRSLRISCDADCSHILDSSRLISTLNGVGVQTEVSSSGWHPGSDLRLCIDSNICPRRHSFELHVESQCIRLIAADATGLLYAVNTLVQVLKLHSDYITNPSASGSESGSLIVNFIKVPCMSIHDWPDVASRGVIWSHSRDARSTLDHMKDFIVFMSEVRMNQLFLRIDCENFNSNSSITNRNNDEEEKEYVGEETDAELDDYHLELITLDEISHLYCIEVIPTVVITSTDQKVPSVILKRNFLSTNVTVIFNLAADVKGNDANLSETCSGVVHRTLQDLVVAGYKCVTLSCCEWMQQCMNKSPARMAVHLGLNALHYPMEHFFPELPLSRCLMSTKSLAMPLLRHTRHILKQKHNSSVLLPAMGVADFYYPTILLKHLCFLQAGAAWNHESLEDILGGNLDDHSMLRPALSTLLFQTYNPSDIDIDNSEELYQNRLLDILTSSSDEHGLILTSSQYSCHSQLNEHDSHGSPNKSDCRSPAEIEAAIWGTICSTFIQSTTPSPITKDEAALTLKRTKHILASVNWKVADSKKKDISLMSSSINMVETEEYMRMLHLVNVVCRIIVMSFNSAQKPSLPFRPTLPTTTASVISMEVLIDSLSPGTSSDLANAILEAMTLCSLIWSQRLDARYFSDDGDNNRDSVATTEMSRMLVERYIFVERAELPLLGIFGAICRHMPTFSPDVLMKIFDDTDDLMTEAVVPAPSSVSRWSLW